jgi:acyl-CoA thioesterase
LAYTLDAGSPFAPVVFNHINVRNIGACASLDFAIRILVNDFDMSQWHLREEKSVAAGAGRTFQDCHVKDENGRIIASMTEQCILRPKKQKL